MAEGFETEADVLRRLEERLDRAAQAAERLLADAAVAAAGPVDAPPPDDPGPGSSAPGRGGGDPPGGGSGGSGGPPRIPPAGWQRPADEEPARSRGGETELLVGILTTLRDRIPPELQQRLADAVREVLMALRALIDWYLELSEHKRAQPTEVQDIPIL
jgi:hypothetical protein